MDICFPSCLLLKWLETPTENMRWCGWSLKEITNLDWKLKVLKNKFNFSLSLGVWGGKWKKPNLCYTLLLKLGSTWKTQEQALTCMHFSNPSPW